MRVRLDTGGDAEQAVCHGCSAEKYPNVSSMRPAWRWCQPGGIRRPSSFVRCHPIDPGLRVQSTVVIGRRESVACEQMPQGHGDEGRTDWSPVPNWPLRDGRRQMLAGAYSYRGYRITQIRAY